MAYVATRDLSKAETAFRRVLELDSSDGLVLYNCAAAAALLGEQDRAVLFLRRAFESGFRAVAHAAQTDSAFAGITQYPEFTRLVAELG